jgi:hypothetical protein
MLANHVAGRTIREFDEALVPSACGFRWALDTSAPTTPRVRLENSDFAVAV